MQFTGGYLTNLKRLNNRKSFPSALKIDFADSRIDTYNTPSDDDLFQLLIIEGPSEYPTDPTRDQANEHMKLVYGTHKNLTDKYKLPKSCLPTSGAHVEPEFVSPDQIGVYSSVRFLLQCRLLSQMMVYTWVDEELLDPSIIAEVRLIRDIFNTFNIVPPAYRLVREDEGNDSTFNLTEVDSPLSYVTGLANEQSRYLIRPEYSSYSSIRLALLLGGQAYYTFDKVTYHKLGAKIPNLENAIYSTYELIWEYALDVTWDSFYATRIDLSQAGLDPQPPFTKVTLGYPPCPQLQGQKEQFYTWATAPAQGGDFPFYPPEASKDFNAQEVQYITPPFPYLPLSCS